MQEWPAWDIPPGIPWTALVPGLAATKAGRQTWRISIPQLQPMFNETHALAPWLSPSQSTGKPLQAVSPSVCVLTQTLMLARNVGL